MNVPVAPVVSAEDSLRTGASAQLDGLEPELALWLAEVSADAARAALQSEEDPSLDQLEP